MHKGAVPFLYLVFHFIMCPTYFYPCLHCFLSLPWTTLLAIKLLPILQSWCNIQGWGSCANRTILILKLLRRKWRNGRNYATLRLNIFGRIGSGRHQWTIAGTVHSSWRVCESNFRILAAGGAKPPHLIKVALKHFSSHHLSVAGCVDWRLELLLP